MSTNVFAFPYFLKIQQPAVPAMEYFVIRTAFVQQQLQGVATENVYVIEGGREMEEDALVIA